MFLFLILERNKSKSTQDKRTNASKKRSNGQRVFLIFPSGICAGRSNVEMAHIGGIA